MTPNDFLICTILSAVFYAVTSSSITFGFETISSPRSYANTYAVKSTVQMTLHWNAFIYQCTFSPLTNKTGYFCASSDSQKTSECETNSSSRLPPYGLQIDINGGFELDIDRIMIQETDDEHTVNTLYDFDYFIMDSEAIDIISASASKRYIFFQFTSNNVYFVNGWSGCTPKSTSSYSTSSENMFMIETIAIVTILIVVGLFICLFVYKHQKNKTKIDQNFSGNSTIRPDEEQNGRDNHVQQQNHRNILIDNTTTSVTLPPLPEKADLGQDSLKSTQNALKLSDLGQDSKKLMNNQLYFVSTSDRSDGTLVYQDPDSRSDPVQVAMPSLNMAGPQYGVRDIDIAQLKKYRMDVSSVPSSPPEKLGPEPRFEPRININCQQSQDEMADHGKFVYMDEEDEDVDDMGIVYSENYIK